MGRVFECKIKDTFSTSGCKQWIWWRKKHEDWAIWRFDQPCRLTSESTLAQTELASIKLMSSSSGPVGRLVGLAKEEDWTRSCQIALFWWRDLTELVCVKWEVLNRLLHYVNQVSEWHRMRIASKAKQNETKQPTLANIHAHWTSDPHHESASSWHVWALALTRGDAVLCCYAKVKATGSRERKGLFLFSQT